MSTPHTPGPWYAEYAGKKHWSINCASALLNEDRRSEIVAEIIDPVGYMPLLENKANAKLIAAAPALLAQLEEALEFLTGYEDTIDGEDSQPAPNKAMILCRDIRATIENAKGNTAF